VSGALLTLCVALVLSACAKSSDLAKVEDTNRVQNQRLSAIEGDVGKTLKAQQVLMQQLSTDVRAMKGRMDLVDDRTARMANEQKALTDNLDRSLSDQRKLTHQVKEQLAKMERYKLDTDNDLDKMRIQVGELEKLLKSPIAGLPDKTEADKAFRGAYYHLLNGEFDVAADAFAAWRKTYPKDPRGPEALFRQGQAFFLMRRYDHALIPLYELLDKSPKSEFAAQARWLAARSLEETGDFKLARQFYAQLINDKTPYAADATRRVAFINRLFPRSAGKQGQPAQQGKQ